MTKKKSNSKKGKTKAANSKVNKKSNKRVLSKKSSKTSNKSKKAVNKSKKTQKQKAKQILSQQTWRNTKDTTGKLRKGRRKTLKLITQADTNRYQTLIRTISDYYKKAGFDFLYFLVFLIILFWCLIFYLGV